MWARTTTENDQNARGLGTVDARRRPSIFYRVPSLGIPFRSENRNNLNRTIVLPEVLNGMNLASPEGLSQEGFMDQRQMIRELAYQMWEIEGRPEGRALEHWVRAEHKVRPNGADNHQRREDPQPRFDTDASDQEGIRAAREYERGVKRTENGGQEEAKAKEAEQALDGAEGAALKKAEQVGKSRRKGEDMGGAR
jgi:hypothetical protein